jgi:proteasome accessory factor B
MLAFRAALIRREYPNARTLAEQFEVSVRTAQRDIEYLRDQLGWEIEYDPDRRGYRARGPLPMVDAVLTEGDLVAVMVALPLVASYGGTAYGRRLKAVFERLCAHLTDEVEVRLAALDQALSARGTAVPIVDPEVLEAIQDGLRESRAIRLSYRTRSRGGERTEREVDPYHLCCVDGQWYLVGFCHLRKEVRLFAAWRIERAVLTGKTFQKPADFDASRYFAHSFRVFCGQGAQRVVLRLSGLSASLIQERPVPTEERRRVLKDGRLELVLRPSSLEELQWWVLGFGGECEVVSPRKLREMIRGHAERMLKSQDCTFAETRSRQ